MKVSYICILFAFMTLIASAQSDNCNACRESPSMLCMTITEYCNLDDEIFQTKETCGDIELCNRLTQITINNGRMIETSIQCCVGNECDNDFEDKRHKKEEPNGFSCPSCYKNDTADGCDPGSDVVECIGRQNECVNYSGLDQLSDGELVSRSFQGCITPNGCKFGFAVLPRGGPTIGLKMKCTAAVKK